MTVLVTGHFNKDEDVNSMIYKDVPIWVFLPKLLESRMTINQVLLMLVSSKKGIGQIFKRFKVRVLILCGNCEYIVARLENGSR